MTTCVTRKALNHIVVFLAAVLTAWLVCLPVAAQNSSVVARASSVTGRAQISSGTVPQMKLTRGYVLNPGDRVDTRGGGRVVIELSDGSIVLVQPETVLVLKDFSSAATLHELFDITLGRVRVRINHFAGRPNPYRMNSPTAAIAVRGTDFVIDVNSKGATRVFVLEGSVEVTSLTNPGQSILLSPGKGVLVAPGQAFRAINSAPRTQGGDRADSGSRGGGQSAKAQNTAGNNGVPGGAGGSDDKSGLNAKAQAPAASNPGASDDRNGQNGQSGKPQSAGNGASAANNPSDASPRALAGTYERYIADLAQIAQLPFMHRFDAFAENHLDSLENPAYASDIRQGEVSLFVLPTFHGVGGSGGGDAVPGIGGSQSADYSIAPQFSLFVPVGKRSTVGGSFTAQHVGSATTLPSTQLTTETEDSVKTTTINTSGQSTSQFYSGAFLASTRFGAEGRTSIGVEVEQLRGTGSLLSLALASTGKNPYDRIDSQSDISQTRLTFGVARVIGKVHKASAYYRYGLIDATDRETTHLLLAVPQPLGSTGTSGHSSEVGLRLRGVITPHILYGISGAWLGLSLQDGLIRSTTVPSHQRDGTHRGSASAGLGFVPNQHLLFSLDVAGGTASIAARRAADKTGGLLQNGSSESQFISVHGAILANVTKRLFANATFLAVSHSYSLNVNVYPDQFGKTVPAGDTFFPLQASAYLQGTRFSDFGGGFRFPGDVVFQYVFSTDYGFSSPSHTLMLRYDFKFGPKQ